MKKYKFIDLFAGCGGLEDGFMETGYFECVSSVEWLKPQVDTLRLRLKNKWKYSDAYQKVLHFDIQREEELFKGWSDPKFGESQGLDYLVEQSQGVDLIIGGPPCQAYSIAGRVRDENGMRDDYRNYLFEHYLSVVDRYQPKVFIFENVPGILSAMPNDVSIISTIEKTFLEHGYVISSELKDIGIINAVDYGVPQNRRRVIIFGVRKDLMNGLDANKVVRDFYEVILPRYKSKKKVTVQESIGDLSFITPIWDEKCRGTRKAYDYNETVNWHKPRYHNLRDMDTYRLLAKDIETGEEKYVDTKELTKLYEKKVGSKSPIHRYHVLRKDEPSTTIIAHLYKDGHRYIHYDSRQARTITPREAARLQSFDDDFEFLGSQGNVYQMIGNAVPPRFAFAIGMAVKDVLDEIDRRRS